MKEFTTQQSLDGIQVTGISLIRAMIWVTAQTKKFIKKMLRRMIQMYTAQVPGQE